MMKAMIKEHFLGSQFSPFMPYAGARLRFLWWWENLSCDRIISNKTDGISIFHFENRKAQQQKRLLKFLGVDWYWLQTADLKLSQRTRVNRAFWLQSCGMKILAWGAKAKNTLVYVRYYVVSSRDSDNQREFFSFSFYFCVSQCL